MPDGVDEQPVRGARGPTTFVSPVTMRAPAFAAAAAADAVMSRSSSSGSPSSMT